MGECLIIGGAGMLGLRLAKALVAKGTIGGKPGVMGGFWGSHLGLIDLMLERDGNAWKVVS